jgi:hypothetical protein
MTVINSMFLLRMNQVDAYYCFERAITVLFPTYFQRGIDEKSVKRTGLVGIYAGCYLIDQLIEMKELSLFKIFKNSIFLGKLWAFPCKYNN